MIDRYNENENDAFIQLVRLFDIRPLHKQSLNKVR